MNHDQPKSILTEEQVAEVERRLRDANPTFMTVDEVRERLYREKIRKQRELLREDKARITPETPIESLYDEKTGLPK